MAKESLLQILSKHFSNTPGHMLRSANFGKHVYQYFTARFDKDAYRGEITTDQAKLLSITQEMFNTKQIPDEDVVDFFIDAITWDSDLVDYELIADLVKSDAYKNYGKQDGSEANKKKLRFEKWLVDEKMLPEVSNGLFYDVYLHANGILDTVAALNKEGEGSERRTSLSKIASEIEEKGKIFVDNFVKNADDNAYEKLQEIGLNTQYEDYRTRIKNVFNVLCAKDEDLPDAVQTVIDSTTNTSIGTQSVGNMMLDGWGTVTNNILYAFGKYHGWSDEQFMNVFVKAPIDIHRENFEKNHFPAPALTQTKESAINAEPSEIRDSLNVVNEVDNYEELADDLVGACDRIASKMKSNEYGFDEKKINDISIAIIRAIELVKHAKEKTGLESMLLLSKLLREFYDDLFKYDSQIVEKYPNGVFGKSETDIRKFNELEQGIRQTLAGSQKPLDDGFIPGNVGNVQDDAVDIEEVNTEDELSDDDNGYGLSMAEQQALNGIFNNTVTSGIDSDASSATANNTGSVNSKLYSSFKEYPVFDVVKTFGLSFGGATFFSALYAINPALGLGVSGACLAGSTLATLTKEIKKAKAEAKANGQDKLTKEQRQKIAYLTAVSAGKALPYMLSFLPGAGAISKTAMRLLRFGGAVTVAVRTSFTDLEKRADLEREKLGLESVDKKQTFKGFLARIKQLGSDIKEKRIKGKDVFASVAYGTSKSAAILAGSAFGRVLGTEVGKNIDTAQIKENMHTKLGNLVESAKGKVTHLIHPAAAEVVTSDENLANLGHDVTDLPEQLEVAENTMPEKTLPAFEEEIQINLNDKNSAFMDNIENVELTDAARATVDPNNDRQFINGVQQDWYSHEEGELAIKTLERAGLDRADAEGVLRKMGSAERYFGGNFKTTLNNICHGRLYDSDIPQIRESMIRIDETGGLVGGTEQTSVNSAWTPNQNFDGAQSSGETQANIITTDVPNGSEALPDNPEPEGTGYSTRAPEQNFDAADIGAGNGSSSNVNEAPEAEDNVTETSNDTEASNNSVRTPKFYDSNIASSELNF